MSATSPTPSPQTHNHKTQIIAHRGYSKVFPENTLLAFERGFDAGADGIELDVHLSRDGVPVVIHDVSLARTARMNGIPASGMVFEKTWDELRTLDVGSWKDPRFQDVCIPRLSDVLAWAAALPRSFIVHIELKAGSDHYPGIEKAVAELIHQHDMLSRSAVSSFDHYALTRIKKIDAKIATGCLMAANLVDPWIYLESIGASALHFHWETAPTPANCAELQRRGFQLRPWTLNHASQWQQCFDRGIDALITDCAEEAVSARSAIKPLYF